MSLLEHADRELELAGYHKDDQEESPNKWMREGVFELLKLFSAQGHSGFSAPYAIELFKKLASFEILTPLTGNDDEWNDVSEISGHPMWQNKRYSHVFKEGDGVAYDISGKVFEYPDGSRFTNGDSKVNITFPYIPKSEYIKVDYDEENK